MVIYKALFEKLYTILIQLRMDLFGVEKLYTILIQLRMNLFGAAHGLSWGKKANHPEVCLTYLH